MKKPFVWLLLVLLAGGLTLFLPYFLSDHNSKVAELQREEQLKNMESNTDTIDNPEIPYQDRQPEIYDLNQMYFSGIEVLYEYLTFAQVEEIKQRIQAYTHQFISENLLDCSVKTDSVKKLDNTLVFELTMTDVKKFEVQVITDSNGNLLDVIIYHSL